MLRCSPWWCFSVSKSLEKSLNLPIDRRALFAFWGNHPFFCDGLFPILTHIIHVDSMTNAWIAMTRCGNRPATDLAGHGQSATSCRFDVKIHDCTINVMQGLTCIYTPYHAIYRLCRSITSIHMIFFYANIVAMWKSGKQPATMAKIWMVRSSSGAWITRHWMGCCGLRWDYYMKITMRYMKIIPVIVNIWGYIIWGYLDHIYILYKISFPICLAPVRTSKNMV